MTFNSILNTLLSHANNDKALLDSFIGQVEAETLVSDNPDLPPCQHGSLLVD